jgi:hypothetical protein
LSKLTCTLFRWTLVLVNYIIGLLHEYCSGLRENRLIFIHLLSHLHYRLPSGVVLNYIFYIERKQDLDHSTITDCVGGHYEKKYGQQFHQHHQNKESSLISRQ